MDKQKMKNPRIWQRMAGELAALDTLASKILCDQDYNEVMDKRTWDRLFRVIHEVSEIRSRAEDRAAKHGQMVFFYGSTLDKARKIIVDCRESLRVEAEERTVKFMKEEKK
nr:hypothetical protein [uncultured Dysosmobacter sp.]